MHNSRFTIHDSKGVKRGARRLTLYCALCIVHCALFLLASSFEAHSERVIVEFKNNQTLQKSNELATNMLKVVNTTSKNLNFYVGLNLPEGWARVGEGSTAPLYSLEAGDSMFIPVKLLFKGKEEGDISYTLVASLLSEATRMQFASTTWSLQIKKESTWVGSVDKTEAFFINNSDTSSFHVAIQNTGNSTQWLTVKFIPHVQMQLMSPLAKEGNGWSGNGVTSFVNISLRPGQDTVIYVIAKVNPTKNNSPLANLNNPGNNVVSSEKYPLRVLVESQQKMASDNRVWKTTINFVRTSNEVRFNSYNRTVLPLTVELNLDNFLQSAAILNLNLYGNAALEGGRTLSYRFQSYFTDQYFNTNAFKGNYHYLGYNAPKGGFEIGNIVGWGSFGQTPSGVGAKGEYKLGANKVGLFYIQNPDLFIKTPSIRSAGINHQLDLTKISIKNYYQHSQNDFYKTTSDLAITGGDIKLSRGQMISLRAGGSNENHIGAPIPFTTQGVGSNLNYSGGAGDFTFRVASSYGSKYYTGFRGMTNVNSGVSYKVDPKYTWSFNNAYYWQSPVYFDAAGNQFGRVKNHTDRYELLLSIRERLSSYNLKAAYYYDDLMAIRYYTRGLGLDYRTTTLSQSRFNVSVFGSYIKLPDFPIDDYFTAQVRTSYHFNNLTTNIRYYYGPYQAFEHAQFAMYHINHQSIFLNSYYGFWLLKGTFSLEPSLNYSYETLYKRTRFSVRPELNYFSPGGLKFNMYVEYILSKQNIFNLNNTIPITVNDNNESPMGYKSLLVGFSLKKEFGVPLPGKKFFTAQVVVFKDINGNMKQDQNEGGVENTLVVIRPVREQLASDQSNDTTNQAFNDIPDLQMSERGEELITDDKGRAVFRNLPPGVYKITTTPLVKNADWFATTEQVIMLDKSQEVPVSFNRGIRLVGSVLVDHSLTAGENQKPDLSRIRVTALDSAGKVYSCLTDNEGRFELYVPQGQYRVSVNQKAIDDKYEMPQGSIAVDLMGKTQSYSVSFHMREKERTVKVKRFDANGNEIK